MRIASRWLWFAGGALFAGTLGGPLVGAVASLGWTYSTQGGDRGRTATQVQQIIRWLSYVPPGDLPRISLDQPQVGHCEAMARGYLVVPQPDDLISRMQEESALMRHAELVRDGVAASVGHQALYDLPAPILGGLSDCLRGSILWRLCLAEVKRVQTRAQSAQKTAMDKALAEDDREMEAMWCAANRGLPQ